MANVKIHQHMAFFQEKNELIRNFSQATERISGETLQMFQGNIGQQQLRIMQANIQRLQQQFNFFMEQLQRMEEEHGNIFVGNTI